MPSVAVVSNSRARGVGRIVRAEARWRLGPGEQAQVEVAPRGAEGMHHAAEGRVARLQEVVHRGREPTRNVPVLGFGEHVTAASEADAAVAHHRPARQLQAFALGQGNGRVGAGQRLSDEIRRGQSALPAPRLQHGRGAGAGQQAGAEIVEALGGRVGRDRIAREGRRHEHRTTSHPTPSRSVAAARAGGIAHRNTKRRRKGLR